MKIIVCLFASSCLSHAALTGIPAGDPDGFASRSGAPLSREVDLSGQTGFLSGGRQLFLVHPPGGNPEAAKPIPAQFEPARPGAAQGSLWWFVPEGGAGVDRLELADRPAEGLARMTAQRNPASGRWDLMEGDRLVLGYNYQTNEPGAILAKVHPDNVKYARARGDYIHPLCGLQGEALTKDWSLDHPHHRGIYWAWPEVDYGTERGDLHALQRVFARPTGQCAGRSGPLFATIEAENLWLWEDREAIVRERAVLRAWRAGPKGRLVDLCFEFTALKEGVSVARRGTEHYGGLNIRLAAVKNQEILFHTDAAGTTPRRAWASLSGQFEGSSGGATALTVFQHPANPDYPGDWVKYPDINWFQPTFPAARTRYILKRDQTLKLQFRLWIQPGTAEESAAADGWSAYVGPRR